VGYWDFLSVDWVVFGKDYVVVVLFSLRVLCFFLVVVLCNLWVLWNFRRRRYVMTLGLKCVVWLCCVWFCVGCLIWRLWVDF
jgi:hypothetical protein